MINDVALSNCTRLRCWVVFHYQGRSLTILVIYDEIDFIFIACRSDVLLDDVTQSLFILFIVGMELISVE